MKRLVIAIVGALALAGCATQAEMPIQTPSLESVLPTLAPTTTPAAAKQDIAKLKPTMATAHKTTPTHKPSTKAATSSGGGPFRCVDGTISHARHRQGACSHHGGIA